jgi:hypothetical protein
MKQIIFILLNISLLGATLPYEEMLLSDDPQIKEWLKQITNPEFQVVDSLINLFLDNMKDNELSKNILKVLRYEYLVINLENLICMKQKMYYHKCKIINYFLKLYQII